MLVKFTDFHAQTFIAIPAHEGSVSFRAWFKIGLASVDWFSVGVAVACVFQFVFDSGDRGLA